MNGENLPHEGDSRRESLRWELPCMSMSRKEAWCQEGSEQAEGEEMPQAAGSLVLWGFAGPAKSVDFV